ncbi:MAG: tRNA (N6-threonylcarbamoyladenosine(37)-N6)-methyltransferase TrmO [Deltaproteobacteria bacterium CG07_land_8_20_14_0_80_60_11]|nr:MAG: tRNA (N6-threonylcarbamoyladenosine(37)-N6)-methyltransferase TrmO [Deltaproteobacteria bacterium CG07_land_8_20_14_0_80_60_11]
MRWRLIGGVIGVLLWSAPIYAENPGQSPQNLRRAAINSICLNPVGVVKKQGSRAWLEVFPEYAPALAGLQDFSHLWVFFWFHGNDNPEERRTLQVHPRRDPANPLTGVFATRAPVRPNLIGFTACRIIKVAGNVVEVADLDAQDGSPLLDLKPYIPGGDAIPEALTPEWLKRSKPPAD